MNLNKFKEANPNFPDTGRGQPNISIILHDTVGEYGLPTDFVNSIQVRELIDSFDVEDILGWSEITVAGNTDGVVKQVLTNCLIEHSRETSDLCLPNIMESVEEGGTYWWVTIWGNNAKDLAENVNTFLTHLKSYVQGIIDEASGDDDFFDYAPSVADMYRQACEYFNDQKAYNKWAKGLPKDFIEEAIYVKQL